MGFPYRHLPFSIFLFLKLIFVQGHYPFVGLSESGSQGASGKHGSVWDGQNFLIVRACPCPDISRKCWRKFLHSGSCLSTAKGECIKTSPGRVSRLEPDFIRSVLISATFPLKVKRRKPGLRRGLLYVKNCKCLDRTGRWCREQGTCDASMRTKVRILNTHGSRAGAAAAGKLRQSWGCSELS